ncbi:MAG: ribosome small subunit-dependent GTPase A [Clostridiales bacterium]|nr:ribosome small subunit-dependent GTPase A [Clostridiales bacterium]
MTIRGDVVEGIIVKGLGGLYDIRFNDGRLVCCKAKGVFRHEQIKPMIGDWVEISTDAGGNQVIESIGTRRSLLIRPPIANVEVLFIVLPSSDPAPDLLTADKLISIAECNHIEPVIVITKSELSPETADSLAQIYETCGFSVFSVSSNTSEGIDDLRAYITQHLQGRIAAFAGASGVGKSTLMNALFPTMKLETGEVSRKTSRGRHTTRHVQLFSLTEITDGAEEGYIADTPGFSMLDFVRFDFYDKEELPWLFREFEPYLNTCRYTGCTHTAEEGCAVLAAVREGRIPVSRHQSFLQIYGDIKDKKPWNSK